MAADEFNRDPAFGGNRPLVGLNAVDDLDRQKTRRLLVIVARREARIPQPIENLIGIDVIAPGNLADGNARKSRLRADHPLLVIAPVPALALLRHDKPR